MKIKIENVTIVIKNEVKKSEKFQKIGWINVYFSINQCEYYYGKVYPSKETALQNVIKGSKSYIDTISIIID